MFKRIITGSIWYRRSLYTPMLIAVLISLCLIGAAVLLQNTFDKVVQQAMNQYGANVILYPESERNYPDSGIAVEINKQTIDTTTVQVATTQIDQLLKQNPAWVVRGDGKLLVGQTTAEQLQIRPGDTVSLTGKRYRASILMSGTRFDRYMFKEGQAKHPDIFLLQTENPERYAGREATILSEMIHSKYAILQSIHRLMYFIAMMTALAAIITVINLARVDASRRSKEFGIFKSLGGSFTDIATLVQGEFTVLLLTSILLGIPAAHFLGWIILRSTTDAVISFDIQSTIYIVTTALIAFGGAALRYISELKKHVIVNDLKA